MRKLLLSTVALAALVASAPVNAADLPVAPAYKAPAIAAPFAYNWSGFYVGLNAGWGRARAADDSVSGFVGGGQIGANWQMNNFLLGVETDIQWSDQKKSFNLGGGATETDSIRWFGTTRARAGVTFDRFLAYVTGGIAYGEARAELTVPPVMVTFSQTKAGWAAGGGVEAALADNISIKAEYLHVDFGSVTFGGIILPTKVTDDIVRLGINYRFGGGGAVVARY